MHSTKAPQVVLDVGVTARRQAAGWCFTLRDTNGGLRLRAEDAEPEYSRERLELLSVIRGLEALDQPSSVVLRTSSRYVRKGLRDGLEAWRRDGWRWERFGRMTGVRNADLWKRLDRALQFHRVECAPIAFRGWRDDLTGVGRRGTRRRATLRRIDSWWRGRRAGWSRVWRRACRRLVPRPVFAPTT